MARYLENRKSLIEGPVSLLLTLGFAEVLTPLIGAHRHYHRVSGQ
jgi:hypothetical protein